MIFNKDAKKVRKILFLISLIVFLFSATCLVYMGYEYYYNKKLNDDLSKRLSQIIENGSNNNKSQNGNIMQSLIHVNSDIKGIIKVRNSKINYPIVQCDNNEFYIKHDVKKNKSKYGTIFIDYRNKLNNNSLAGQNVILYGHNMKDGSMFADLKLFKNKEFYKNNQIVDLAILPKKYKFQIFSVFVVNADFDYRKIYFHNDEEVSKYLKLIKSSALYFKNVEFNCEDTMLTLSTCSYDRENARLVVQGKLIKSQ